MYEFCNPNHHRVEVTLPGRRGILVVDKESCVPTQQHEKDGIGLEVFEPYVPSFLRPTPPAVRRRLLAEEGHPIPETLVAATSHLPEFQGVSGPEDTGNATPVAPPQVTISPEDVKKAEAELARAEAINSGPTPGAQTTQKGLEESELASPPPAPPAAPPPPAPAAKAPGKLPSKGKTRAKQTKGVSREESSQELADALCSSTRAKRAGRNIDNP